jgi:hypothetical protein
MIRPAIKVNDKVRFRTDGEIGKLIPLDMSYRGIFRDIMLVVNADANYCSVESIRTTRRLSAVPAILLEICNNFSDIAIGDEVEVWTYCIPQGIERTDVQKVYRINDGKMYLDGDKYPFNISDGFPITTEHPSYIYRCIRIVKKQGDTA